MCALFCARRELQSLDEFGTRLIFCYFVESVLISEQLNKCDLTIVLTLKKKCMIAVDDEFQTYKHTVYK